MKLLLLVLLLPLAQDKKQEWKPKTTMEAITPFQALVGSWRCAGLPEPGSDIEPWDEEMRWQFRISKKKGKRKEYSLHASIAKGKFFKKLHLEYIIIRKIYRLTADTTDKKKRTFEGKYKKRNSSSPKSFPKDRPPGTG